MVTGLEMKERVSLLETILPHERFHHSLRVARTAAQLARHYGKPPEKAFLAGIYHDIAREWSSEKLKQGALKRGRSLSVQEQRKPILLHGWIGSRLVQEKFAIDDSEIIEAIENHVLGGEDLGSLAKIIYISDYIEPGRKYHLSDFLKQHQKRSLGEFFRWVDQNVQSYYK